ncbi:hypothetical protein B0H13DRAFT_2328896 [Mycena leptocephala]|nr:hypothetical protein B0H13DRAFT_2328896 [Mycena leptocephala]
MVLPPLLVPLFPSSPRSFFSASAPVLQCFTLSPSPSPTILFFHSSVPPVHLYTAHAHAQARAQASAFLFSSAGSRLLALTPIIFPPCVRSRSSFVPQSMLFFSRVHVLVCLPAAASTGCAVDAHAHAGHIHLAHPHLTTAATETHQRTHPPNRPRIRTDFKFRLSAVELHNLCVISDWECVSATMRPHPVGWV